MNSGDRVIDVGSEWRTFSNDKATKDPSRVGDTQNPLLSDGDLSTMIGKVILKILNFNKFECFYVKNMFVCLQGNYSENVFSKRFCLNLNSYISVLCKMWLFSRGQQKRADLSSKRGLQCCGVTCRSLVCCCK